MADTAEDRSAALAAQAEDLGACGGAGARESGEGEVESVLEERSGQRHVGEDEEDEGHGARRDELCLQTGAARGELGPRQRVQKLQHPRRARHRRPVVAQGRARHPRRHRPAVISHSAAAQPPSATLGGARASSAAAA